MSEIGIHWLGPFYQLSGYGSVSRNYLRSIQAAGIPLSATHMLNKTFAEVEDVSWLDAIPTEPQCQEVVLVAHGIPGMWWKGEHFGSARVRKHVGVTIFETDRLPAEWIPFCNEQHEIWVPSQFNKQTFAQSGVDYDRLRLVHYSIDADLFKPSNQGKCPSLATKKFKFLYITYFDYRKGYDLLLEAYYQEFKRREDVTLVLKVIGDLHYDGKDAEAKLNSLMRPRGPHIQCIFSPLSTEEMIGLYQACDVYVSTDRANGWGIPCMEAMALGKPAMTIDWSGSTEFMTAHNSILIKPEPDLEPVAAELQKDRPIYTGHKWARVKVETVREALRLAYENAELRQRIGAAAAASIAAGFSHRVIGQQIKSLIC